MHTHKSGFIHTSFIWNRWCLNLQKFASWHFSPKNCTDMLKIHWAVLQQNSHFWIRQIGQMWDKKVERRAPRCWKYTELQWCKKGKTTHCGAAIKFQKHSSVWAVDPERKVIKMFCPEFLLCTLVFVPCVFAQIQDYEVDYEDFYPEYSENYYENHPVCSHSKFPQETVQNFSIKMKPCCSKHGYVFVDFNEV